MAGISNPYFSQIEHGLRAPSEAVLDGIAATLGVSPEALRPGTNDDHGPEKYHDHDQERPTEHT
jgi:transcriptional regulator with XRE-family HTH domain